LDEIIHAWEDVKAMFNGGTRKRILSSPSSPSSRELTSRRSQPTSPSSPIPMKKPKESPNISASSTPTSSSTTTNVQSPQYPMRPLNFSANTNPPPTPTIVNSTPPVIHLNPPPLRAPSSFPQELPFSLSARSFMIDYMWHHQQQSSTSINAPTAANKASNHFQFAPYSALNWIKQPPQSFLFKPNGINEEKPPTNFNHFHSAFKPVINGMRMNGDDPITTSNGVVQSVQSPASSTSSSNYNQTTSHSDDEQPSQILTSTSSQKKGSMECKVGRQLKRKGIDFYVDVDERVENGDELDCSDDDIDNEGGESQNSRNQMTSDDENEVVDIETTEDDVQILNLQPAIDIHKRNPIDDEIEISGDEKNNNLENYEGGRCSKSPIKSLKEIVGGNDEFFMTKRNRLQSSYEWSQGLNLKKEVS
jgi:hypothetical protein